MEMEMTYCNTLFRPVPCWCIIVPYCIFHSVLSSVFLNIFNISIISLREKSPFSLRTGMPYFSALIFSFFSFYCPSGNSSHLWHGNLFIYIVLFFSWFLILWKIICCFLRSFFINVYVFYSFGLQHKWIFLPRYIGELICITSSMFLR